MTTVPAKSHQPLHNFSLPFLKWGQRSHVNTSNRCRRLLSDTATTNPHRPATDSEDLSESDHKNHVIDEEFLEREKVSDVEGEVKPWNLRPRRPAISNHHHHHRVNGTRGLAAVEKRKLWISLSKEEIEEDVYALTGSKAARRPKKRNKTVQKQVDNVFPGLYLTGTSADSYRV